MEMIEILADLCHQQWSGWMKWLFKKCGMNQQGDCVIPREYYKSLCRQMETDYQNLSEVEQDSDREEAEKFLSIFLKGDKNESKI
jgi:hypothetical protein